ncbi:MAG: hypothetical protein LUD12_13945 [Lachnospiraceae bacterium]|nr:hypothetical protein [Lachnospiraceae bacterium]
METRISTYKGYTEARKKANAKYETEKIERVSLALPKGKKSELKSCAEKQGESMNRFIINAIDERTRRLKEKHLYWVSFIISFSEDSKPQPISLTDACLSIEEAKEKVLYQRKNYNVLSAWIDTYYGEEKETVFHECYLNFFGDIKKPE